MQATKPVQFSPVSQSQPIQVKPKVFSKQQKSTYLVGITIESTAKLLTNILLSLCVTSALLKLLPHYQSIQEKLQVIESEIEATTDRLNNEKEKFSRYFDPSQAKTIMQEQSNRVDSHQIPIIWLEDNGIKPSSESTPSP
ncbi:MAG: hypothetical protein F6K40_00720 [Okeania sp. SIO3I5]|uniref:slr1601 family putative cell division protein n=1 Tax=Okeania sp. SIO3I5 TaxID=2607805 RepID=UPI0013B6405D|nr:hypothetical protein [Okeania sp. SIO3I5]NEQ34910.1 hypothetical protein [Okeania sp. SIO3I5]